MTNKKDYKTLVLPAKYVPKKTEPYMCPEHKAYFYQMLIAERAEIETQLQSETEDIDLGQKLGAVGAMDEGDAASLSMDTDFNIKMQERGRNHIKQIEAALERLEKGTYGYSVISGDEIGLKRLMVRPVATITIEEKEDMEK
jgi:DnaK suppressor protein